MIYVVLGMHKSGTTLISKILHESGIQMGEFDSNLGYDEGNKFERLETHDLNIEILQTDYTEFSLNVSSPVRSRERVSPALLEKLNRFIRDMNDFPYDWGFKDPRTCLTYQVWKTVLPAHRLICIFRDPISLWRHYQPKVSMNWPKSLLNSWKSLTAWFVYNQEILNQLESEGSGYYLARYGNFMQNDAAYMRLCKFTGKKLKDCRDARMFRSKAEAHWLYRLCLWAQKFFCKRDIPGLYEKLQNLEARQFV